MRPVEAIFAALHECGYSPLPISRRLRASDPKPFGKAPGLYKGHDVETDEDRWFLMKGWNQYCYVRASIHLARSWGRMIDSKGGGIGVACGYNGLVSIDVDDENLVDEIRRELPHVMVAKRGRKGFTAFYRGEHPRGDEDWWKKRNYKSADGRGLLDFLADGSQTVIPPSFHADTGKPYVWLTPDNTLLNTSVEQLPAFTNEHRSKMEAVLRRHGWSGEKPAQTTRPAVVQSTNTRSAKETNNAFLSAAKAARAQWLPKLNLYGLKHEGNCWLSVASFRASSTGQTLETRGLNLKIYDTGAIKDYGTDTGYNDVSLAGVCLFGGNTKETRVKAFHWLKEQINWSETPLSADQILVDPTYPDQRASLDDAVLATVSHVERFFSEVVPASEEAHFNFERRIELWRLGLGKHPLWTPRSRVIALPPEAGLGKSTAAETPVIGQKHAFGRSIVLSFQTIKLAEERAEVFRKKGLKVQVYRGYNAEDPDAPDHKMCRNIEAYNDAKHTVGNIRAAICERRVDDGTIKHCPYFAVCGKERQRSAAPDLWFVTSPLLMTQRPEFIPDPDVLIVDEALHAYCFAAHEKVKSSDWLNPSLLDGIPNEEKTFVRDCSAALYSAIRDNGTGPLSSKTLNAHGITAKSAYRAADNEGLRLFGGFIQPDMDDGQREKAMKSAAVQEAARARVAVWREVAQFLSEGDTGVHGDRRRSGRIIVGRDNVIVKPFRPVHPSWRVPTLYLDATAPPADVLRIVFDELPWGKAVVDVLPDIKARWSKHVTVRQIIDAPIAMGKLGLVDGENPDNVMQVLRYVQMRAKQAAPENIGFITYKGLLDQLVGETPEASKLPTNVKPANFGAVAGLNSMKDFAGLIVLGRPQVRPSSVEESASVLAGFPIEPIGAHFKRKPGAIRLANGSTHEIKIEYHPNDFAEAFRWQVTEANLLQAIGRLRPHRRTAPAWLDIVCNVVLPITVDEVFKWQPLNGADLMVAEGLILTNRRHAAQVFDYVTEEQAKGWGEALLRHKSRTTPQPLQSKIFYKLEGQGGRRNEIIRLPGVSKQSLDDIRALLESKLGRLALFEPETEKLKDSLPAKNAISQSFGKHMDSLGSSLRTAQAIVEIDNASNEEVQEIRESE